MLQDYSFLEWCTGQLAIIGKVNGLTERIVEKEMLILFFKYKSLMTVSSIFS